LLLVHGSVTLGYAIALFINPNNLAEFMGLKITSPDGQAELFTMYVGMSGVMGLFMLFGALQRKWLLPATLFLVLSMSGITGGRLLSALFLETGSYTQNALYYDIPVMLLSWLAYRKLAVSLYTLYCARD